MAIKFVVFDSFARSAKPHIPEIESVINIGTILIIY